MEAVERIAPQGKWRVIAVNTATEGEWVVADCDTETDAITRIYDEARDDSSLMYHIYNDAGECTLD